MKEALWKQSFENGATARPYELEQTVELVVSRGRIVIQPAERVAYDLDALVGGITKANAHDEVDFGKSVGKEAW